MDHHSDWTIGVDLGDRKSVVFGFDRETGEVLEDEVASTEEAVHSFFARLERCRVVLEAGGHSRWMKRVLTSMGFEVIVADPRRIALVSKSTTKNDHNDAMRLAELGSVELPRSQKALLNPIEHRDDQMQADLSIIKARDTLVGVRTRLINSIRGMVKATGARLRSCSTPCFHRLKSDIPAELSLALDPLFDQLALLTKQIRAYDRTIERVQQERYPEAAPLMKIRGVAALTALTYCLTLAHPSRFRRSRDAAAYVGLCPKQHESGASKKDLGITKTGDKLLRRLLVHSAHYILGPFGEECDLRRWGEKLVARAGRGAKKRAAVAVARKLAVVMHRLWADQSEYQPLRHQPSKAA